MKQTDVNEDLLTRYLLGELPEDERARVEDEAFADAEILAQLLAVENDLVDEYVRGELTGEARHRFERMFLNSAERRRKIAFAGALGRLDTASLGAPSGATAAAEAESTSPDTTINGPRADSAPSSRLKHLFGSLARFPYTPQLSFAALVLILLIGGALFFVNRQRREETAARRQPERPSAQPASTPGDSPSTTERPTDPVAGLQPAHDGEEAARPPAPKDRDQLTAGSVNKRAASSNFSVAALVFSSSGVTRGESRQAKRLVLSAKTSKAQLTFELEPGDEYGSYQVELRTVSGSPVLLSGKLISRAARSGRVVRMSAPANKLPAGSYEATLRGVAEQGRSETIGYYYFNVVRP
jgi:anti-sigma factor RsiW